jgi:hypothetical protein
MQLIVWKDCVCKDSSCGALISRIKALTFPNRATSYKIIDIKTEIFFDQATLDHRPSADHIFDYPIDVSAIQIETPSINQSVNQFIDNELAYFNHECNSIFIIAAIVIDDCVYQCTQ